MKKKRIGNDIAFAWTIVDKEGYPYSLEGRDLTLTLSSALGCNSIISPFTIGGDNMNVVMWTFYGKDQKTLGKYTATLVENLGDIGMKTVDKIDAIYLVAHTYQEGGEDSCSHLTTETVELESIIETAAKGDPGPHFTPSVDGDGNLSWTNNGGLPNPETVNIKGPKGDDAAVTAENIEEALGYVPQEELESGVNIKTINGESILGSGNIEVQGGGSDDAVLYTPQVLTDSQKNQARENIETVGATVVSSIAPAEQYVSQELMNLLAVAPTMQVKWNYTNDDGVTNKRILVNHPLMNYEDAEIVLLSYAKKNGARSKSPGEYNKGYSIATPWKDPSDYFTFASETPIGVLSTFMESFRGWNYDAGAWTMPKRTRHFGIALRIPNPAYDGPETPNKNNTYHGVPESIWSAVLRVGIYASYNGVTGKDDWGIGIK